jgi:flagellar biosynthesis protein
MNNSHDKKLGAVATYKPNANQQAIALAYESSDYAPRVVAKGRGLIAEQIIAKAKENGVFVHESKDLVALLMQVDLDDHIPPELYLAIAEILAWLYRLEAGAADIGEALF